MSRDDQRVGLEALGIGRGIARERAAADLLVALDAELDPDRGPAHPRRAAPRRGRRCWTSCRRCRGRRARRRARSARTAASPTATRPRPAPRRSGCTAARSARPEAPGSSRSRPGRCPAGRGDRPRRRRPRTARSSSRRRPAGPCRSDPGTEIDGIRTRSPSSRRSCGISSRTRPATSNVSAFCSDGDDTATTSALCKDRKRSLVGRYRRTPCPPKSSRSSGPVSTLLPRRPGRPSRAAASPAGFMKSSPADDTCLTEPSGGWRPGTFTLPSRRELVLPPRPREGAIAPMRTHRLVVLVATPRSRSLGCRGR